jgi:transposase
MLARYAQLIQPKPLTLPAEAIVQLKALVTRRRELVALQTAEKNRLQQNADAWVKENIDDMIAHIAKQIKVINTTIAAHIAAHPTLKELHTRLRTMPGVGAVTAAMLIAFMPELGNASRGEIAALAGVAPFVHESGQWKGKAFCAGGRAPVRECLYMAAVCAVRGTNRFATIYTSLIKKGKPSKVALVAVMRKMLTALNAMVEKKTDFNPETS